MEITHRLISSSFGTWEEASRVCLCVCFDDHFLIFTVNFALCQISRAANQLSSCCVWKTRLQKKCRRTYLAAIHLPWLCHCECHQTFFLFVYTSWISSLTPLPPASESRGRAPSGGSRQDLQHVWRYHRLFISYLYLFRFLKSWLFIVPNISAPVDLKKKSPLHLFFFPVSKETTVQLTVSHRNAAFDKRCNAALCWRL